MKNNIEKILVVGLLFAHHPNLDIGGAQSNIYKSLHSPIATVFVPYDISTPQDLQDNLSAREDKEDQSVIISDPKTLPTVGTISAPNIEDKSGQIDKKNSRDEVTVSSYSTTDMLPKKTLSSDSMQPDISSSVTTENTNASVSSLPDISSSPKDKEIIKTDNKKYFSPVVDSIVVPSRLVNFDMNYVKSQIHILLSLCYSVQDGKLLFTPPSPDTERKAYTAMDNVKNHMKGYKGNGFVKLLIGKKALRNFIEEELDNIYRILVINNKLQYKGGKEKFEKDFHSLLEIYK